MPVVQPAELWELADRRAVFQTADHDVPVRFLAFSSDGSILASADGDGKIVFLDTADGSIRSIVRHAASVIQAMALSPDGTLLAIAGDDLTLRLVTSGGRTRNTIRGTRGGFLAVAFSPEGDRVAAGSDRGTVYEWRVEDGNEIARHAGLRERVAGVGFTADGRRLVAVSAGGAGRAWSAGADADGVPLATTLGDLVEVAFDPTGRWMACASRSRIKIWSLGSSEPTGESELPVESSAVNGLAVAPDGRWFAVGDAVGTVHVGPFAEPQP